MNNMQTQPGSWQKNRQRQDNIDNSLMQMSRKDFTKYTNSHEVDSVKKIIPIKERKHMNLNNTDYYFLDVPIVIDIEKLTKENVKKLGILIADSFNKNELHHSNISEAFTDDGPNYCFTKVLIILFFLFCVLKMFKG